MPILLSPKLKNLMTMTVEAITKRGMMCLQNNYLINADNSKIMEKQL